MSGVIRGVTLVGILMAVLTGAGIRAAAQGPLATTTVQDTVYSASGTPASGTVLVSWSAFTAASGVAVPAGSTSLTIGSSGALTIALVPNAGATPMGSYYTATFHLSDGTTSREYWVVPVTIAGGGPARLAQIENQVLPTSVAMQTVSRAYVDTAIARAVAGVPAASSSPYVLKAGDTMTGPLALPADPVSPNQAADKNYVDESVAAIASGLAGAILPGGTLSNSNVTVNTACAGTGATATVVGTDYNHVVTVTMGTGGAGSCALYTLNFTASRGHVTYPVQQTFNAGSPFTFAGTITPGFYTASATGYTYFALQNPLGAGSVVIVNVIAP